MELKADTVYWCEDCDAVIVNKNRVKVVRRGRILGR